MSIAALGGDPSSIRTSARSWSAFGQMLTTASSDLSAVQTGEFEGDEGNKYRERISRDLVPHLNAAAEAWSTIGDALVTYANGLDDLQARMASVRTAHGQQQAVVNRAFSDWQGSVAADARNLADAAANRLTGGLWDPDAGADSSTYVSQTGSAWSQYSDARNQLRELESRAAAIRTEHLELIRACCGKIGQAKAKRPVDPPSWLESVGNSIADGWNAAMDWVAENADLLKTIADVLSAISAVTGLLAMIPVLTPIMAPIALVTGAASLGINVLVSAATGEWDPVGLGLQALSLVPFVKPLVMAGRATAVSNAAASAARGTSGLTAVNQAQNALNRTATAFEWIGFGADLTSSALTTVQTYQQTGNPWQAALAGGVSLLGTGIPNTPRDVAALQGLVSSGTNMAYTATEMALNGKPETWQDWVGLGVSMGSFGMNYGTAYAYQNAGTTSNGGAHPNGIPTHRFEKPDYLGMGSVPREFSGKAGVVSYAWPTSTWKITTP